jgi:hypothetical protein
MRERHMSCIARVVVCIDIANVDVDNAVLVIELARDAAGFQEDLGVGNYDVEAVEIFHGGCRLRVTPL